MALNKLEAIEPVPGFEMTVDGAGLAQVLHTLEMADGSGLLAVQGEEDLVSLTLRQGDVCAVDAMNHSMEDSLGEVLAQQGVLSPADYRAIMDSVQSDGEFDLCSEALIATGKVERRVVLEAVRSQISRQCLTLLRWHECSLQWVLGAESPYQQGIVPLPISEILLRSISELGESGPLQSAPFDYTANGQVSAETNQRVRLREAGDELSAVETRSGVLIASPVELAIVERLGSGVATLEEILDSPGRQGWRVRYGLYRLAVFGHLLPDYEGAGSRPHAQSIAETAPEAESSLLTFGNDDDLASLLGEEAGGDEALPALDLDAQFESQLGSDFGSELGGGVAEDFVSDRAESVRPSGLDDLALDSRVGSDAPSASLAGVGELEWGLEEPESRTPTDPGPWIATLATWSAKALALLLVLAFVRELPAGLSLGATTSRVPGLALDVTDEAAQARWAAQAVKLTRALEVYHLVHGTFPGDIEVLADLDLVAPEDLENDRGRRLAFELEGSGFRIDPLRPDALGPLLEPVRGNIVGNFFLNPRYIEVEERSGPPPVRIVDR